MLFPATLPTAPTDNFLIGALPEEAYCRLQQYLEPISLPLGKVLSESDEGASHVYFPTAGTVSLCILLKEGTSGEIAVVGSEGVVGISSFLEAAHGFGPRYHSVVTMAGQAYRLRADVLRKEFARGGELRHLLLRYTQALIAQMAQIGVCNRHHRLEAQLCRWLLLRLDRLVGNEMLATHEQIANHLGVRREGVSEAAIHLQSGGLIRYSRGHLVVLDRSGLEQQVCECYGVIEREYARLLRAGVSATRDDRMGGLSAYHRRVTSIRVPLGKRMEAEGLFHPPSPLSSRGCVSTPKPGSKQAPLYLPMAGRPVSAP